MHLTISALYNRTVGALNDAAHRYIPKVKRDALKHWWDEELDSLKQKAMLSNSIWIDSGKPAYGQLRDLVAASINPNLASILVLMP